MTTPAPAAQQQQPYQPSQVPPPPVPPLGPVLEAQLVTTAAGLLVTAVSAAAVLDALKLKFTLSRDLQAGLFGSATIAMEHPAPITGTIGPASERTAGMNLARRAQFVLAAGKRLAADIAAGRSGRTGPPPPPPPEPEPPGPASGQTADLNLLRRAQFAKAKRDRLAADIARGQAGDSGPVQALQAGLVRERRYYAQHLAAMWSRAAAAGQIDMEAAVHGPLLGWAARHDKRVTAACLDADGGNFYVDDPPDIGLPGVGPHVGCRCTAVAPWPGGRLLAGSGARRRR